MFPNLPRKAGTLYGSMLPPATQPARQAGALLPGALQLTIGSRALMGRDEEGQVRKGNDKHAHCRGTGGSNKNSWFGLGICSSWQLGCQTPPPIMLATPGWGENARLRCFPCCPALLAPGSAHPSSQPRLQAARPISPTIRGAGASRRSCQSRAREKSPSARAGRAFALNQQNPTNLKIQPAIHASSAGAADQPMQVNKNDCSVAAVSARLRVHVCSC